MLYLISVVGLATASVSFTISRTSIFSFLRKACEGKGKLEELIHCPFCLNMWLVFASFLIIGTSGIIDYFLYCFAAQSVAGITHFILLRSYEPVAKSEAKRKIDKLKKGNNG